MSIPEGHSLIRIRGGLFEDLTHVVAPFDHGFLLPADHPVATLIAGRENLGEIHATVNSTDEFLWRLDQYKFFRNEFGTWFRAEFVPFIESFRNVTPDDEVWLNWAASQAA